MESEIIIEVPNEVQKKTFYVYYDNKGTIKQISKKLEQSPLRYVTTTDTTAGECIAGRVNQNHYCVSINGDGEVEFMHKKSAGSLLPPEELLYQIPIQTDAGQKHDIEVQLYPNHNIITIDISSNTKRKLLWGIDVEDLNNPQGSLLNLYITRKNNPDYLIMQLEIDPIELVNDERIVIELNSSLLRYVDFNDISIFTRRLFETYSYKLIEEFVDYDPKDTRRIKQSIAGADNHIQISRDTAGYMHVIGVEDLPQLTPEKNLQFYVVDATINRDIESRYIGTVYVPVVDVVTGKTLDFKLPENYQVLHKYNLKVGAHI